MNKIKFTVLTAAAIVSVVIAVSAPQFTAAAPIDQIESGLNEVGGGSGPSLTSMVKTGIEVLLFVIGALSVAMIAFGGLKYVTSHGDSAAVASAKNTILYAVVGLVIAIASFAIVQFVVGRFQSSSSTPAGGSGGSGTRR